MVGRVLNIQFTKMPVQSRIVYVCVCVCIYSSIHPCCYSSFWSLASLKRCLYSSLSPAFLLHPFILLVDALICIVITY